MSEANFIDHARTYFEQQPNRQDAFAAAEQLERNASRCSRDAEPFIYQGIPVNAAYDGNALEGALDVLRQGEAYDSELPETILCLNARQGTDPRRTIQPTTDLVKDFQQTYPDMPLSFFIRQYPKGTPISTLRGDVTDGMLAYRALGERPLRIARRMLFIAHDADMSGRSIDYAAKMYEKITEREDAFAARSALRFARTGLPRMDTILTLDELHYNLGFMAPEQGTGFDLERYCNSAGYPSNSLGETIKLIKSFSGFVAGRSLVNVFDATVETSNRYAVDGMTAERPFPPWHDDFSLDLVVGGRGDRTQPLRIEGDISDENYQDWVVGFREGILTRGSPMHYNKRIRTDGFSHEEALESAFGLVKEMQTRTNLSGILPLTTAAGNEMVIAALREAGVTPLPDTL